MTRFYNPFFISLWRWHMRPVHAQSDREKRYRMLFLGHIILIVAPVALLVWVLSLVLARVEPERYGLHFLALAGAIAVAAVAYIWNRAGKVNAATILLVVLATFLNIFTFVIDKGTPDQLHYMILTTFLASVLLKPRALLGLFMAQVGAVLLFIPLLRPDLSITAMLLNPVAFMVLSTLFFFITLLYHRNRENQLAESEERYRIISELTSSYAYAFRCEPDGHLVTEWVTGAFKQVSGYEHKHTGLSVDWVRLVHPEDLPIAAQRHARLISGQTDISEYRLITKDGEIRWIQDYGNPILDEQGRVKAIYGAAKDISERKQYEQERAEDEIRYRALFENNSDGVFIISLDGYCLKVNQNGAAMLGYTIEELIGKHQLAIVPPDEHTDSIERREKLLRGEKIPLYERTVLHKDGTKIPVELNIALVKDASGQPRHIQSIMRDIGERKRVENNLRQAEQIKSELIRITSHDLRNPLAQIKGNVALLRETIQDEKEEQRFSFNSIEHSIEKIQNILEKILTLEHAQYISYNTLAVVEADVVLLDVLMNIQEQARSKKITIHTHIPEALPKIKGSILQLQQAFFNLIENAIKYTPSGGQVDIRAWEAEERLYFEVEDTGYGIPLDRQGRLFERFYRAYAPGTQHIEGTGLGLSIVKTVIERHSGGVYFRSQEGVGSTFGCWLPVLESGSGGHKLSHN